MKTTNTLLSLLTTTLLVSDQILPSLGSSYRRRRRHRNLAYREDLWITEDVNHCSEESYRTALVIDYRHLFYAAIPNDESTTNCPVILTDNGYVLEDDEDPKSYVLKQLVPHVTIDNFAGELEQDDILFLDYDVTLGEFVDAIHHVGTNPVYEIDSSEYDMIDNNCATFMLNMMKTLGFDYKEPETSAKIQNFVGKLLAENPENIKDIRTAYLNKHEGFMQKAKFHAWTWYVGEDALARHLVKSYMAAGP